MSPERSRSFRAARAFVLAQIALPVMLLGCKNSLLFYPWDSPTAAERLAVVERAGEAVLFEAERPDGRRLIGYDARPEGGADTPVLLVFHGNAGNVAHRAAWLADLVEESRLRVVLASYSGYGGNEGSPSEETIYADALAAFDTLVDSGVPPWRIVVYGESIGGGPASVVATPVTANYQRPLRPGDQRPSSSCALGIGSNDSQ